LPCAHHAAVGVSVDRQHDVGSVVVEWWRETVVRNSRGIVGGVEWGRRDHGGAEYGIRFDGEASLVETTPDGDQLNDGIVSFDHSGACVGRGWWAYFRGFGCSLRVR